MTTLHSTPAIHHRFHILDALRGVASVIVVFWHAPGYLKMHASHSNFLAVDFFFCLSGFVIAFSYERRLETTLAFGRFAMARFIRLYPMYLLGITLGALAFLLVRVHFPLSTGLSARLTLLISLQFVMLPNLDLWKKSVFLFPLNFPAWSMFFEVLANLGYAGLVRKKFAGTIAVVALYLISVAGMAWWCVTHPSVDVGGGHGRFELLGGAARVSLSFLAGVLVLRFFRARPRPHFSTRLSAFIASAIGAALVLLLLTPFSILQAKSFHLLVTAALFPALVYLGALCKAPASWVRPCTFLGDISYPLYLLHVPFMALFDLPAIRRPILLHPSSQPLIVPFVLVVSLVVSYAALKLYDTPLRAFLTRKVNTLAPPKPVTS